MGIDEQIVLAKTTFKLDPAAENPFTGTIHFNWKPYVQLHASGGKEPPPNLLDEFLDDSGPIWKPLPHLELPKDFDLPSSAAASREYKAYEEDTPNDDYQILEQSLQRFELAPSRTMTAVHFLLPNGWRSNDGLLVRYGGNRIARARTEISFGDWRIRLDKLAHADRDYHKSLINARGYGITHIGRISRFDNKEFRSEDFRTILKSLNFAFSLMTGRHTSALLPIGSSARKAVWTQWDSARVDPAEPIESFRDSHIANTQFTELGRKVLATCTNELKADVLRLVLKYLIQANRSPDPELAVGGYVTGLLLLAHNILVVENREVSGNYFRNTSADILIGRILNAAKIDMSIPGHFEFLQDVSDSLKSRDGVTRDALGCITKIRNEVMHPTSQRILSWSAKQWIECRIVAHYFLETCILYWLDYKGQYSSRMASPRWAGDTHPVPWG
ncbi:hypothetical protein FHS29_002467 [Saccharothrix tamanrassetensis]|uniref:YopA central domain-containing protein n=1 Tax=Saccharothrix tamanrassetensis TaxID=1051531 RepID=A0A841CJS2_9PSEU|nr:hypothetical protein [Saccharothrix tamanrassetensis]MBB5955886.1 hypothetical protein [Saccharothrix tamanrassetensis]